MSLKVLFVGKKNATVVRSLTRQNCNRFAAVNELKTIIFFCANLFHLFSIYIHYSPKWRWLDVYRGREAASLISTPLSTDTEKAPQEGILLATYASLGSLARTGVNQLTVQDIH